MTVNDRALILDLYAPEGSFELALEMQREDERCLPLKDVLTGEYKTPKEFYDWHVTLWNPRGQPQKFKPEIFHPDCLLTDPFLTVKGSFHSALYFKTLFAVFPKLSGPHYSWAANDTQIFVNWAFKTSGGAVEIEVPATDLFCFKDGIVYYRLATFDVFSLVRALIAAYGRERPRLSQNLFEEMYRWHADADYAQQVLELVSAQNATGGPPGRG